MKKLVLFGAGKIGRSFIGQLFSRSGYEVVFIDVFKELIEELNKRGSYNVVIKSDEFEETMTIKNARGVLGTDIEKVSDEISTADVVATSVGMNVLPIILPTIAKGLVKRYDADKNKPLDIIIAENMRDASDYFEAELKKHLASDYPFKSLVGLVETSIGKMVPIMSKKDMEDDILQVFAEPYNTLILDKKGFINPIPEVEGIAAKENVKAWVDRKSFIHNLGHAATSYIGYLYDKKFVYLYEALAIKEVYSEVRGIMLQSAEILLKEYPGEFTMDALVDHIDDLLKRFTNKALGDTIYRVGMDLMRKLGPEDRVVGIIKKGIKHNMPVDKILTALVSGMYFRAVGENGQMFERDVTFVDTYFNKGIKETLVELCQFDAEKNKDLIDKCLEISEEIQKKLK